MRPLDKDMLVDLGMTAGHEAIEAIMRKACLAERGQDRLVIIATALAFLAAKRAGLSNVFEAAGLSGMDEVVKELGEKFQAQAANLLAAMGRGVA